MRCVICEQAEVKPGYTTVRLERGAVTLVFKNVPARICPNCGEAFVDEAVTARLLNEAETIAPTDAHVDVRQQAPAG